MVMLIAINNGCNGESRTEVTNVLLPDKPVTIPTVVEKNEPAHRGHAVKKPVIAPPIPLKHVPFLIPFFDLPL